MRSLAVLVLAFCLVGSRAFADVYTVNDYVDAVDANLADGLCLTAGGMCSLRAAVQQANAHAGADDIFLPTDRYALTLSGAGEDAAATGDLDVTDDLTITGLGVVANQTEISGISADRVFDVKAGVQLTVALMQIDTGAAVADPRGGGILNDGTLTLDRVMVVDNSADDGAGNGAGGGLYNSGTVTLRASYVASNKVSTSATATGGGIHNTGTVTVINSTIGENNFLFVGSQAAGAGIYNAVTGTTDLRNATIAFNGDPGPAPHGPGAGVFNAGGTVTLQNTAIGGNSSNPPQDCSGTLTSGGYNLIGDPTGCTLTGDLTGVQTGVSVMLFNGPSGCGATPVLPVGPSSPLIDAGNPAPAGSGGGACEARDQCGHNRAIGVTRCDIGAEEVDRCPVLPIFDSCEVHQQAPRKGKLDFKNHPDDAKDGLKWDFVDESLTADALFGTGVDDYTLCVWDETGPIGEAHLPGGGTCDVKPCWTDTSKGLKYSDKPATPDGITLAKFTASRAAKIGLKGKGTELRLASPPWSGKVTVHLRNDGASPVPQCWETIHSVPKKNLAERYTAPGD